MSDPQCLDSLRSAPLNTPAFVIDLAALQEDAARVRRLAVDDDTRLLFALKSFSIGAGLAQIAPHVDGFAASSLFEAQLARRILGPAQTIHVTTPGLRPDEVVALGEVAHYLSFNSLEQWWRHRDALKDHVHCGLRVNPQLSFVADARYDPCRKHSKLGVPIDRLRDTLRTAPETLDGIEGLHFHTNCDSGNLAPLRQTVEVLLHELDPLFSRLCWVNLGGGYLFDADVDQGPLEAAKRLLRERGIARMFIEPGAAIARRAGNLVASVVDLFETGTARIAVLDASVNHMPEVFEYQFEPDVAGEASEGPYTYQLAGSSCLAGDVFGSHAFEAPLDVGTRIVFPNMGAYSMVKANMFNGINLPTVYALKPDGAVQEIKHFEVEDYLALCGL